MYETVIKSIMRSASDSIPADWSNAFRMRADDRLYSRDQGISEIDVATEAPSIAVTSGEQSGSTAITKLFRVTSFL